MLHRLDHANCGAIACMQRKAETAIKFRRPTKSRGPFIAVLSSSW